MGNCLRRQPVCGVHETLRNQRLNPNQFIYWESKGEMTMDHLERLRDCFWFAMIVDEAEGEVWKILENVVKALLHDQFELAQEIMSSSDLYVPYGELAYVLDFHGNMYHVPAFTLCAPANLVKILNKSDKDSGNGNTSTESLLQSDCDETRSLIP